MDVLEFAFWFAVVSVFAAGAIIELVKIMIKAARKERRFNKWKRKFTK